MAQLVPRTPSCHEFFLCLIPFLKIEQTLQKIRPNLKALPNTHDYTWKKQSPKQAISIDILGFNSSKVNWIAWQHAQKTSMVWMKLWNQIGMLEKEWDSATHHVSKKGSSSLLIRLRMILSLVTTSNLGPGNWPFMRITFKNQTEEPLKQTKPPLIICKN